MYFQRHDLVSLKGMDVPGQADALGLGWVYMAPKDGLPGIIQKTGGGGGFITYMAMIPAKTSGVRGGDPLGAEQIHQHERSGQPSGERSGG